MNRVAIIGAGIGREHLAAFRRLPDIFSVRQVVDQNADRIEEIRQGDSFAAVADIQTALNAPDVDIVDICLPPHLHVPVALEALAAGKHVICEKPLATSMNDIDRLRAAVAESGRLLFPVFQYRWGPAFSVLRALQEAGLTGQPITASAETHWSRGTDYYAVPWRGTWAGEQGGAVLGHAIHNHDLLTCFMGPVARVAAMVTTRVNDIETEDCATISLEMTNGAMASSSVTLGAATDETRLRFVFEKLTATSGGTPYAPGTGTWTFTARDPGMQAGVDQVISQTDPGPAGFDGFFAQIAKSLAGEPSDAVTLEDGVRSVELVTAIYHASRTHTYVKLPLSSTHPLYTGWQP